jgi:hypothetical protein
MQFKLWLETSNSKLPFYGNCVGWPEEYLDALSYMVQEGEEINFRQFQSIAEGIDKKDFLNIYGQIDRAVSFHRVPNWPIAFYRFSGIEYVYAEPRTIELFQLAIDRDDVFDHGKNWFDTVKYPHGVVSKMAGELTS